MLLDQISGQEGREADDLALIVIFLQEWAQQLFPKVQFTEFLRKVEGLCEHQLTVN